MNHPRLRDVRKIAVLGPDGVGEFMFCLPALHALKHSYPDAQLVCLGLPWHAAFLAGRPGPVDRSVVAPTIRQPGAALEAFVDAMRAERFDLALQMAGGGRYANALLARFDARLAVGMRSADAAPLDRAIAYGAPVNRRLQLLEVAALAGARAWPMKRQLQATLHRPSGR
jgi:ADP-heptose:LPS heptosyltransferase